MTHRQGSRTCADVAAVGVHPSLVVALQHYRKALKVYETTGASRQRVGSPTTHHLSAVNCSEVEPTEPTPAEISHASVVSIRNRLLLDITADYVCEKAFRELFVDHRPFSLQMCSSGLNEGDHHTSLHPYNHVKGPRDKEFTTINVSDPTSELVVDDMLWIVDNRKANTSHLKVLTAWQDNFKATSLNSSLAMPPPASTHAHAQKEGKGPIVQVHSILPNFPLAPSAIGVAQSQQILLHRRNVMLTREYFASAAAAESEYRVSVQDLAPPSLEGDSDVRSPFKRELSLLKRESSLLSAGASSPDRHLETSFTPEKEREKEKEKEGGLNKFIRAFSKALSNEDNKQGKGAESASDVLAASASSVAAALGRISRPNDGGQGHRVGGALISEKIGLPPVAWRETLALNIITQWTYTLTIAVVKLVTTTIPKSESSGEAASFVNKELIVVRHLSRRVYAQPTKAMFHTKDHRGESGDKIDYPNIYFNIDDFEDNDLFGDIKLCEGYTLAVLLTAGATRNSNATVFRGALSYDIVMERIKRNTERNGGKGVPISSSNLSNTSFNDAFSGRTGASFVMGTEYTLSGKGNSDSHSTPKMFIPLVGPERKGKAELAVSILEVDFYSSQVLGATSQSIPHPNVQQGSLFKDNFSQVQPSLPKSSSKEKDENPSGLFGRLLNKVKGKPDSESLESKPPTNMFHLQGNEAIQCCLTFVSVHAQHVMDVLLNTEAERSRQWLSFYETSDDLTRALRKAGVVEERI